MSTRSHIALLGAGLLSLAASASAQPPAPPPGGPGGPPPAVRTELQADLSKKFDAADANHDGTLTVGERAEARANKRTAMRTMRRDAMFARLDTDKNGAISKAEFEAAPGMAGRGRDRAERGEGRGRDHGGKGMRGRGGPDRMAGGPGFGGPGRDRMAGGMMMGGQLAAYRDKPIPKAVFMNAGLARFDRVDTNHDGKISPAERDAARKAMRDRFAPADRPVPSPPGT